jgi:chromate reductase
MSTKKIALLVGSLRQASYARKLANVIVEVAPAGLGFEFIQIDNLPFYNQDLDEPGQQPQAWRDFRAQIQACDGLLFVMPEYNRGVPGVLKNAIDVGSRPAGKSVWGGKPSAIVSISQGPLAGYGANHHLRQALVTLNAPCMGQPEAYIGNIAALFDAEGKLADGTRELFVKYTGAFERWIGQLAQ